MCPVGEQRFIKDSGGGDLVCPGRVATTRTEMDRRVVAMPGEKTGEWESDVVPGTFLEAARLHAANAFADQLVRPRPRLAGGFVGAVEVDHHLMPGGFCEQRVVEIDDLLVLVVEEVNLRANDSQAVKPREKLRARSRGTQFPGVAPEPETHALLPRVIHQFADLVIAPSRPEALNDVILKAQLPGQTREFLHALEGVGAAIEVFPDSPAGLDPPGVDALWKQVRVW